MLRAVSFRIQLVLPVVFLCALTATRQAVADCNNWGTFRADSAHSGLQPCATIGVDNITNLGSAWYVGYPDINAGIYSSPAVVDHMAYITSADGIVHAFDTTNGTQRWSQSIRHSFANDIAYPGHILPSPAVANGVVYAASTDGTLDAFNAQTGQYVWQYPSRGYEPFTISSPVVANGVVYYNTPIDGILALNAQNGDLLGVGYPQQYPTNVGTISSPAVDPRTGTLYVGHLDNCLHVFEPMDPAQITDHWVPMTEIWTAGPDVANGGQCHYKAGLTSSINSSPAVGNDELYGMVYVGSDDGNLYAFNTSTRKMSWSAQTGGPIRSSPAVAFVDGAGFVYVGSGDGKVYAFDARSGAFRWSASPCLTTCGSLPVVSSPAVAGWVVYVGSPLRGLYAFDARSGSFLWRSDLWQVPGPITSSPAVTDGQVYVANDDGVLLAFDLQTPHPPPPPPLPQPPDNCAPLTHCPPPPRCRGICQ
jgi:outer membrane protein assembly factor BamB